MPNPNLKENKFKRALYVPFRGIVRTLFPVTYVKQQYKYITHHKCDLKNPVRYTEKLQYLRVYVYPRDDEVSRCASRDGVREYLKEMGYENLLISCYGIFDKFEDINFDELPDQFVMKCTHACAFNMIVKDKKSFDKELTMETKQWRNTTPKSNQESSLKNTLVRLILSQLNIKSTYSMESLVQCM